MMFLFLILFPRLSSPHFNTKTSQNTSRADGKRVDDDGRGGWGEEEEKRSVEEEATAAHTYPRVTRSSSLCL